MHTVEFARIESTSRGADLTPAQLREKLAIWSRFTASHQARDTLK